MTPKTRITTGLAVSATLAIGLAASQPAPTPALMPAPAASSDPIDLFARIAPVFQHPRCANCHGAVNPFDVVPHAVQPPNVAHGGGHISTGESCTSACHDQSPRWTRVAPADMSFHNRDMKMLCELQQVHARSMGTGTYLGHLSTDELIGAAFDGLRGGAADIADRPPMGRDAFVEAAAEWLQTGGAGCGGWVGEITQHETFAASYSHVPPGMEAPSSVTVTENAQRIVTVDRQDGHALVRISQGGQWHMRQVMHTTGIAGPCTITITGQATWTGQNPGPAPGQVTITIAPDGSYTIRFIGPAERTTSVESGDGVTDCGPMPSMASSDQGALDWDPWKFTIRCPANFTQDTQSGNTIDCDLFDPERNPRLKGTMVRTIKDHVDAADPQSWLTVSPVGISRSDTGASIPVTIVTTWNFTLQE